MLGPVLTGAGMSITFGVWQNSVYAGIFAWSFMLFLTCLIDYAKRTKP